MILIRIFFILLCMLSLEACKEDEYAYPNVLTELTETETDSDGMLSQLTTDQGETFKVCEQPADYKFKTDTLYRMLTVFEIMNEQTKQLKVYSARPVFSKVPQPESYFKGSIKTDPVDIQSIWRSGNYLNLILNVQTKDKPHAFHFVDQGIHTCDTTASTTKTQVLEITFFHDRKQDYEAFTTKYCFSIPLRPYQNKMRKGDKIRLHINTYKEGETTREFNF